MNRPHIEASGGDRRPPQPRRPAVLVVLRNPKQRGYVAASLRTLGCRVRCASLSRTAHHLVYPPRSAQPGPALTAAVLDLSARPTAGLAALHALRCWDESLPVVVIVRQGDDATRERALRLDPWVLFEGPVVDEALVATVANLMSRTAQWRPPKPAERVHDLSAA